MVGVEGVAPLGLGQGDPLEAEGDHLLGGAHVVDEAEDDGAVVRIAEGLVEDGAQVEDAQGVLHVENGLDEVFK